MSLDNNTNDNIKKIALSDNNTNNTNNDIRAVELRDSSLSLDNNNNDNIKKIALSDNNTNNNNNDIRAVELRDSSLLLDNMKKIELPDDNNMRSVELADNSLLLNNSILNKCKNTDEEVIADFSGNSFIFDGCNILKEIKNENNITEMNEVFAKSNKENFTEINEVFLKSNKENFTKMNDENYIQINCRNVKSKENYMVDNENTGNYMPNNKDYNLFENFTNLKIENSIKNFHKKKIKNKPKLKSIDNKLGINKKEEMEMLDDPDSVYMSTILNLFQNINEKMEYLIDDKVKDKAVIKECYKKLVSKNYTEATTMLKYNIGDITNIKIDENEKQMVFIKEQMPNMLLDLRRECVLVKNLLFNLRSKARSLLTLYEKNMFQQRKEKKIIKQKEEEFKRITQSLVSEANETKYKLIEILKTHAPSESLESRLEVDLVENIKILIVGMEEKIKKLKEENTRNIKIINDNKRFADEIANTKEENIKIKDMCKKLQCENVNFSRAINKLNERNINDKKSLVLFNNELKKMKELIKTKNETIEKQKNLIYLFQNKLCVSTKSIIEELKNKQRIYTLKLKKEKDSFKKTVIEEELADVNKRLNDFLSLQNKNN